MEKTLLQDIWAKNPKESLAQHTDYVVNNMLALKERYFEYLPNEQLWKDAFIAALFHDLGKLCENFQDMIQDAAELERDDTLRSFGSELLSKATKFSDSTTRDGQSMKRNWSVRESGGRYVTMENF